MKKKKIGAYSTFLGPESSIEGVIKFEGAIRLDGRLKGTIESRDGTLLVGESAVIDAEITVGSAIISGEVTGTITARDKIVISRPGRVVGDIEAPEIAIETGAAFNGNCGMKGEEKTAKKVEVPLEKPKKNNEKSGK